MADTVNANGEQFGGSSANGQPTGIGTNSNAQVNVVGSNNGIALGNGSTLGAYEPAARVAHALRPSGVPNSHSIGSAARRPPSIHLAAGMLGSPSV